MRFEIYKDQGNPKQWRWRLWSDDKKILAVPGQGHETGDDCLHEIQLVQTSANAPIYNEKGNLIEHARPTGLSKLNVKPADG